MGSTYVTRGLEEPFNYQAEATAGWADHGNVFALDVSGEAIPITAVDDVPEAVLVDRTVDPTTKETLVGQPITGMRHGIVPVRSQAVTWAAGEVAYLHTDGSVTNLDAGSASVLGRYVPPDGETGETVGTAGDKVQVDLDSGGSTLHA